MVLTDPANGKTSNQSGLRTVAPLEIRINAHSRLCRVHSFELTPTKARVGRLQWTGLGAYRECSGTTLRWRWVHGERPGHHTDALDQHCWRCIQDISILGGLQDQAVVTRSLITYLYIPSTPFLFLATAPHTVDLPLHLAFLPLHLAFLLPHPRPLSPVTTGRGRRQPRTYLYRPELGWLSPR